MEIKNFNIGKRGRQYFETKLNGKYTAKLVINDISTSLQPGQIITAQVRDISERSTYGNSLKFDPVAILTDQEVVALRQLAQQNPELERWLGYAEQDADKGMMKSNAMAKAFSLGSDKPEYKARLSALRSRIAENTKAHEMEKAAKYAEDSRRKAEIMEQENQKPKKGGPCHLYPRDQAPDLNKPVRVGSEVLVYLGSGQTFRLPDENDPRYWSPASNSMYEGDKVAYYYYREAAAAEIESLSERQAERKRLVEARRRAGEIAQKIRKEGCYPRNEEKPRLNGEIFYDTRNVYGSGGCFLITETAIWVIENNSMGGDDWSRDNVFLGNGGSYIGYCISYDPAIAEEIRNLTEASKDIC